MEFEKNVPEWSAQGTEPPASLKTSGFEAGYKPPAAYFNWFFTGVSACLKEIRTKLSGHAGDKENPHSVTAAQLGLGNVNNTADPEKSVKYAQTSGTADKVKNAIVVRFNGGSTESTNMWTFDGSTSRSVNITADKIGGAKKDLSNITSESLKTAADKACIGIPIVAAASVDGVAYTATVEGITELANGFMVTIIPDVASTSTAVTLNVNGTGAKMVRLPLSFNNAAMTTPKQASYFTAGRPITLQFDSAYVSGGAWKTLGKQRTSAQDLYGVTNIENGGTGAETPDEARANLGAVAMEVVAVSIPASGWSDNTQTVDVAGVTASNNVIVTPAPASFIDYASCMVRCTAQADRKLTFMAEGAPDADLSVNVLILK